MKNLVLDAGAVSGTDCTAAFATATSQGGAWYVPAGTYLTSGIHATKPLSLLGDGFCSQILTSTGDALTLSPQAADNWTGTYIRNLMIGPKNGAQIGHALRLDITAAGASIPHFRLDACSLTGGTGQAVHLDNSNTMGFYLYRIQACKLVGGLQLLNSDDCLGILSNQITGPNLGIFISLVPGAAQIPIAFNEITSTGGAILASGVNQLKLFNNQIEQGEPKTGTDYGATVVLSGCYKADIDANNINGHQSNACLILEDGTSNTRVRRNVLSCDSAHRHFSIGANSPGNIIDDNDYLDSVSGLPVPMRYGINASAPTYQPAPLQRLM